MQREELAAWLRLAITPGVGPVTARRLLATFGLPQQVFEASAAALAQVASPAQVEALRTEPVALRELAASTEAWLAGTGTRRLITLADPDYPPALLQTADPPLMLHAIGACLAEGPLEWPARALAIVGSRNPTAQGRDHARAFGRTFAQAGWTVVSGLALGVDGAAHEGALDAEAAGLATIAVVGTGLDQVYPRQHLELARRITERGLVLCEYTLGTPPLAENFPRRNRLIAALSQGTLVVEAALQSGSLITARIAVEMGREVFAIPGSVHSPQSRGCHALIRQGAKLVETAQDVLEELAPLQAAASPAQPGSPKDHPISATRPEADEVLEAAGYDPVSFDAIAARTGLPTPVLQARLLELELDGRIARLPGGLFQRTEQA